ncbi:hypothetical protein Q4544_15490 [Cognatishimia sp. 1_MG-2023]|nr:hypothetical protein [Cognatishimia sp. 1_MG-2023]
MRSMDGGLLKAFDITISSSDGGFPTGDGIATQAILRLAENVCSNFVSTTATELA